MCNRRGRLRYISYVNDRSSDIGLLTYLDEHLIDMPFPVRLWPKAELCRDRWAERMAQLVYHDYHGLGAPTDLSKEKLPS
jgi:hypothetical protein